MRAVGLAELLIFLAGQAAVARLHKGRSSLGMVTPSFNLEVPDELVPNSPHFIQVHNHYACTTMTANIVRFVFTYVDAYRPLRW
jgi:hypothetical protein